MERIDQINPERLRWSIDDHGLSMADVARKAGIASKTLEQAVTGDIGLTFKQLKNLADLLGRGVLFFLEPSPVDEDTVHTPQFRTLANQKPDLSTEIKGIVERLSRVRDIYLDLMDEDEDRPVFKAPRLTGKTPEQAAVIARRWLGIDTESKQDFESYRRAVEARGVFVFLSASYAGRWKFPKDSEIAGFSLYYPTLPVIAVRKQSSAARQVFTLMHELGHLLIHKASVIDVEDDLYAYKGKEREANAFAGHLLVPDAVLKTVRDEYRPDDPAEYRAWLEKQTKQLGISTEVILRRLLNTRRLSRKDYEAYRRYVAKLPIPTKDPDSKPKRWRDREPVHLFGDRYVRSVLGAVEGKQLSLSKASSYLDNIKIPDVHKLEKHLASV